MPKPTEMDRGGSTTLNGKPREVTQREVTQEVGDDLADELRAAIRALSELDISPERLSRARDLAATLTRELEGPRRPRWYEHGSLAHEPNAGSRAAYLDQSPVRGQRNPIAPPLRMQPQIVRADGTRALVATATLGSPYEGPPHGVHGGWVAALFDDLLGATQGLAAKAGVTATLKVRYRDITPLDRELRFESWIASDRGRRVIARATCHAGDVLTAEAEALFVQVDFAEIQDRMQGRKASSERE